MLIIPLKMYPQSHLVNCRSMYVLSEVTKIIYTESDLILQPEVMNNLMRASCDGSLLAISIMAHFRKLNGKFFIPVA